MTAQESQAHDDLRAPVSGWGRFDTPDPAGDPTTDLAGPEDLRKVFRRHAAGISVITTVHRHRPVGLLVNSLTSVSAAPPLVSFNVALSSSSWPALEQQDHVGIHVLAHDQSGLADLFARSGADRFGSPTAWHPGPRDIPVLEGVAAWGLARIQQRIYAGDHVILVARLVQADTNDDLGPLLHHAGSYHHAVPAPPSPRLSVVGDDD